MCAASATSRLTKLVLKPRWKSSAAARESSGFGADYNAMIRVDGASEFKGYDHLELNGKVTALFIDGKAVDSVSAGRSGGDPDQTPFYAESGGRGR